MASLGQSFNHNDVEPSTGGSGGLHPEGDFGFEIIESDVSPTSNGKGMMLKLTLQGIDAENKGLKVWKNINIQHENSQAQTIGQGELSALCKAIGHDGDLADSEQLHFRPFGARIFHEQQKTKESGYKSPAFNADGSPKLRAEVKRFLFGEVEDFVPSSKPAAQAPAQPAAPASQSAAPARAWQRKA